MIIQKTGHTGSYYLRVDLHFSSTSGLNDQERNLQQNMAHKKSPDLKQESGALYWRGTGLKVARIGSLYRPFNLNIGIFSGELEKNCRQINTGGTEIRYSRRSSIESSKMPVQKYFYRSGISRRLAGAAVSGSRSYV